MTPARDYGWFLEETMSLIVRQIRLPFDPVASWRIDENAAALRHMLLHRRARPRRLERPRRFADAQEGVALTSYGAEAPPNWTALLRIPVIQMIDTGGEARPDGDLVRLSDDDVPEMLELVAQTKPGPFAPRTIDMGSYVGLREGGRLIAMAGERLRPPG